jgi:leucyl-tRNA synthetase
MAEQNVAYEPQAVEAKWQKRWEETGLYKRVEDPSRPKHYALTMLPYTSGDLHIGHWFAYAPSDARARYMRMHGYNVWLPIGFDAFGLPAENAAIQHNIHPYQWTMDNVRHMRMQLRAMGAMFDWEHEAVSCLPGYYRWTEWFFLEFYERGLAYREKAPVDFCPRCNTTLAREQVWGEDRHCERCGTPVIKKELSQWFFRITNYADELLSDLDKIDWPERVKTMQRNWIGRSEGAHVTFRSEADDPIQVFTTRPDTLFGATSMVLAPEHPLVAKLTTPDKAQAVADYVQSSSRQTEIDRLSTDKEKTGVFIGAYAINPINKERIPIWIADYVLMGYGTGAIMAVPAHDERDLAFAIKFGLPVIPVIERPDKVARSAVAVGSVKPGFAQLLADAQIPFATGTMGEMGEGLFVTLEGDRQIDRYVDLLRENQLPTDWNEIVGARFALIFADGVRELDSVAADREIVARCKALFPGAGFRTTMELLNGFPFYRDLLIHHEYGTMINSGAFTGRPGDAARADVIRWLEEQGFGHAEVNYRLHDWLISRQRMWGAPIPMIYCPTCGIVPVPEEDLPVLLPDDAEFLPTGESPLKFNQGFLNTTCPRCGGPATRETDTMDTFMCSSWYNYAYISPYYGGDTPFDPVAGKYWLPVDQYTGGVEHATMHLLYTRFFTKAMRDMGLVDFSEPMLRLFSQGMILGEDNEKMSKSRGNVINPDEFVSRLGADSVRAFLMFIGPWDLGGSWSSTGIEGIYRFLNRIWSVVVDRSQSPAGDAPSEAQIAELRRYTHQAIRDVTRDMEAFKFNTTLASLMKFNNALMKAQTTAVFGTEAWQEARRSLVLMIAPIMPHLAEELWERIGGVYSVHDQRWPESDSALAADEVITLVVQVNGRVRARIDVPAEIDEQAAKEAALAQENVQLYLGGQEVRQVIYVPGRLINIVVR